MSDKIIEEIKQRAEELQQRLGRQLQVTIYNSSLNGDDELRQAARDVRMSLVAEAGGEWTPGQAKSGLYAVRVVAEGLGEIPYALMCQEAYIIGESSEEEC